MDSTLFDLFLLVLGFGIFETIMGFVVVPRVTLWWILRHVDWLLAEFERIAGEKDLWGRIRNRFFNAAAGASGGRPPNMVNMAKQIGGQLAMQWLGSKLGGLGVNLPPPPPPPV